MQQIKNQFRERETENLSTLIGGEKMITSEVKENEAEDMDAVQEAEDVLSSKPVTEINKVEDDNRNTSGKVLKVVATTAIGAAVGIAGGLALVTVAAAAEGTLLSIALFTKVLGIAGGAAGMAHGASSVHQESKKNRKKPANKK